MFNDNDDANYELFARYDYVREAYGDPCPYCRTLRWQADCPYMDPEVGHLSLNEIQAMRHYQMLLPLEMPYLEDDIVF